MSVTALFLVGKWGSCGSVLGSISAGIQRDCLRPANICDTLLHAILFVFYRHFGGGLFFFAAKRLQ